MTKNKIKDIVEELLYVEEVILLPKNEKKKMSKK